MHFLQDLKYGCGDFTSKGINLVYPIEIKTTGKKRVEGLRWLVLNFLSFFSGGGQLGFANPLYNRTLTDQDRDWRHERYFCLHYIYIHVVLN